MGTTRYSSLYRLLLPFLLALLLGSLVQAQETGPIVSCRVEPNTVASEGKAQFTLRLGNVPSGLDLAQVAVDVNYTNPALITSSSLNIDISDLLLPLEWSQTVLSPGQMQLRAERVGVAPVPGTEDGALAGIDLQIGQASGLVEFTLSKVELKKSDGTQILVWLAEKCFLAVGDTELPAQTPTAISPVITPTATATLTVTPTATLTPTMTETPTVMPTLTETPTQTPVPTDVSVQSPVETPTPTPTETPTGTPTDPALVATPTPRLDDSQSSLATPTPITVTPVSGQTPDIALTLTAEAQAILLDTGELDTATETLILTQPAGSASPPTATPPPLEILSPPRVEDTIAPAAEEIALANIAPEDMVQSASAEIAERHPSINLAVETIQQPPAGILFERSPLLLRLGWISFIAAVVLVFASLWMRRHR